ncbi:MAG TPA: glycoside hydrolase family 38 C-terminal domain-containing protein, partial [Armatimonadota bacterium]|nr:glycoside hydrolase family 38 C-terminal domain-containing protein [Armatimonadota bacterium]
MPERPKRPLGDITVHCIGNAHIDAAWLWRWDETVRVVRETFESALDRMDETPEFIFTCSQVVYFRWMEEQYPELFSRIRERVEEGRWDLAGGWWVQPDCNIPSGESLVRQALYGQRYLDSRFGKMATVGYNPDTFGHCNAIPQLLAKSGMNAYLFFRPGPHEKTLEGETFWWESPDGSRVLASRPPHHYCTDEEELAERLRVAAEQAPAPLTDVMCFYGVGDHGGGPTRRAIASILAHAETPGGPRARFARIEDFYREAASHGAALPVLRDDLQHHAPGCYAVHSEVKRRNRECEQLLSAAESMATLAWAAGGPDYPDGELTQAWAAVLFNQFHDILAGTSIPEVYEDANEMYDEAEALAQEALEPALTSLAARADTRGDGLPLVVFNPLSWAHEVPVEVEIPWDYRLDLLSVWGPDGRQVPVQIDRVQGPATAGMLRIVFLARVGPMGHAVYHCRPVMPEAFPPLTADGCRIENDRLRVVVDGETGRLTSVFDKANGVEVLSQPAADFLVLADRSDTWSHGVAAFRDEVG